MKSHDVSAKPIMIIAKTIKGRASIIDTRMVGMKPLKRGGDRALKELGMLINPSGENTARGLKPEVCWLH
jgi:hypothetical protein